MATFSLGLCTVFQSLTMCKLDSITFLPWLDKHNEIVRSQFETILDRPNMLKLNKRSTRPMLKSTKQNVTLVVSQHFVRTRGSGRSTAIAATVYCCLVVVCVWCKMSLLVALSPRPVSPVSQMTTIRVSHATRHLSHNS